MISASTFAFALAFVVVVCVGAAWIIWSHLTRTLDGVRITTADELRSFDKRLEIARKSSPIELAAEVAALSEAVARLRETHRRFAGRFDAFVHLANEKPKDETPEATRARLRREHGLPKIGGNSTP